MKRMCLIALVAALLALPVRSTAADPYEITALLSLTGQSAFLGREQADTLALIEQSVNKSGGIGGRPLHFTIVDDQSNPQVGLQLATLAIARRDAVVLGPSLTATCDAIEPLFRDGPVEFCFSPSTHPAPGSFVFGSGPPTTDAQAAAIRYFREKGWHRIAIILATDASGQDAERQLRAALALPENASMQLVDLEHFASSDLSVDAQMSRIKAAAPQIVVAWGTGTPEGTLLRGVADVGIDVPIYTSAANLTYAQMKAYAPMMPKVLLFPGYPFVAPEQARGAIRAALGKFFGTFASVGVRPDAGQATCWDDVWFALDALKKYGPDATPTQIRDYVAHLRGVVGIYGPYDFSAVPQRGLDASSIVIVRWDAARATWVGVSKPGGLPL